MTPTRGPGDYMYRCKREFVPRDSRGNLFRAEQFPWVQLFSSPRICSLFTCHTVPAIPAVTLFFVWGLHGASWSLCPLHISRSDAPIGLRCSRRQFGTKPSDVASAHHSHWPNGAQCVQSRRLVRGSRTILYNSLVGTVKESYLLQLSVALYTFGSRSAGVPCQIIPHARSSPIR